MFDLDDGDDDHYHHDNDEYVLFSTCLVHVFYKHTIVAVEMQCILYMYSICTSHRCISRTVHILPGQT